MIPAILPLLNNLCILLQPYRTTPLVLPGAKVKREAGPTESYLRHHPNPNVRSPPHHIDHEHLMKQRVSAVLTHIQDMFFNLDFLNIFFCSFLVHDLYVIL